MSTGVVGITAVVGPDTSCVPLHEISCANDHGLDPCVQDHVVLGISVQYAPEMVTVILNLFV